MKLIFSTLTILALALSAAQAQEQDSTLISERTEGNYLIRQYRLTSPDEEAQYRLSYSISASKLPSLTTGNVAEMVELDEMIAKIKADSLMHIARIVITGYASPDGNAASNEQLAISRAEQFGTMLEERYALPSTYNIEIKADAEQWSDCDKAVSDSKFSDKETIIGILNSTASESEKEQKLKSMPEVWNMFRKDILPAMRRVDMTIYYDTDRIVEVRTFIEKPKAQPSQQMAQRQCRCEGFVDDMTIAIIVDMTEPDAIY